MTSSEKYAAALNPFSKEGKSFVQDAPPFESLPEDIVEIAIDRIDWNAGPEMKVDLDDEAIRKDVLSFYLMCQSIASVSYPYSTQVQTIIETTKKTVRYRMYNLFNRGKEDLCLSIIDRYFRIRELKSSEKGATLGSIEIPQDDIYKLRNLELEKDGIDPAKDEISNEILPQYVPRYAIRWTDLIPLIEHRDLDLTEQYIVKGWALITPKNLWNFFANFVGGKMEDYISDLYDQFSKNGPPSDVLEKVGEEISNAIPEKETYRRTGPAQSEELSIDDFPPCIKKVLEGVEEGNRNYGIIALLTSFVSYARISPSGKAVKRIAEFIDDMSVIEDDIVPLIFEAAENCKPPLFEDQPQEKANVYYHMGFGMTTHPSLKDSGKSKWYTPPNCRKVKTEAPSLCRPDDLCSDIKNPLTYYYKKISKES